MLFLQQQNLRVNIDNIKYRKRIFNKDCNLQFQKKFDFLFTCYGLCCYRDASENYKRCRCKRNRIYLSCNHLTSYKDIKAIAGYKCDWLSYIVLVLVGQLLFLPTRNTCVLICLAALLFKNSGRVNWKGLKIEFIQTDSIRLLKIFYTSLDIH